MPLLLKRTFLIKCHNQRRGQGHSICFHMLNRRWLLDDRSTICVFEPLTLKLHSHRLSSRDAYLGSGTLRPLSMNICRFSPYALAPRQTLFEHTERLVLSIGDEAFEAFRRSVLNAVRLEKNLTSSSAYLLLNDLHKLRHPPGGRAFAQAHRFGINAVADTLVKRAAADGNQAVRPDNLSNAHERICWFFVHVFVLHRWSFTVVPSCTWREI